MQIAPTIAGDVEQLSDLPAQPAVGRARSPATTTCSATDAQWLLANVPFYAQWFRFALLWRYGDGLLPFLRRDPDWPHPERSLNSINERHRQEMVDHIERRARRPPPT